MIYAIDHEKSDNVNLIFSDSYDKKSLGYRREILKFDDVMLISHKRKWMRFEMMMMDG